MRGTVPVATEDSKPEGLMARLLTPERKRFVKFGIVGASGVIVNLLFVWIGEALLFTTMPEAAREAAASALGIIISVFTNFVLNDWWTWGDRPKGGRKRDFVGRALRYYLASAVAVGLQYGVAMVLVQLLDWNLYLGQLVGIGLGMFVNFVINNVWTFRDKTAAEGDPEGTE